MKRLMMMVMCAWGLAACELGPVPAEESAQADTAEAAGDAQVEMKMVIPQPPMVRLVTPPPMPGTPTWPTDISSTAHTWGAFYRPGIQSAFTVFLEHPTDSTRFLAYGFDVKARKTVFFVSARKTDFQRFGIQLNRDIEVIAGSTTGLPDVNTGSLAQIIKRPKGDPSPGPAPTDPKALVHQFDGYAWKKAYNHWSIEAQM